jgi:hypothetical protein
MNFSSYFGIRCTNITKGYSYSMKYVCISFSFRIITESITLIFSHSYLFTVYFSNAKLFFLLQIYLQSLYMLLIKVSVWNNIPTKTNYLSLFVCSTEIYASLIKQQSAMCCRKVLHDPKKGEPFFVSSMSLSFSFHIHIYIYIYTYIYLYICIHIYTHIYKCYMLYTYMLHMFIYKVIFMKISIFFLSFSLPVYKHYSLPRIKWSNKW